MKEMVGVFIDIVDGYAEMVGVSRAKPISKR